MGGGVCGRPNLVGGGCVGNLTWWEGGGVWET